LIILGHTKLTLLLKTFPAQFIKKHIKVDNWFNIDRSAHQFRVGPAFWNILAKLMISDQNIWDTGISTIISIGKS
jgi:hypothetical protein